MFREFAIVRTVLHGLIGVISLGAMAYGQDTLEIQSAALSNQKENSKIIVAVDGLSCGTFDAASFHVGVTTETSSGGAGVGKPTFSDLVIRKLFDTCSPPLFLLAVNGHIVKKVTLCEVDKNNRHLLTILIENVTVTSVQFKGSDAALNPVEEVDFLYRDITITDAAGNTTGRVGR